jgi:hypothetical protein
MIRFPSVSWPESKLVITRVGIPRHLITAKRSEKPPVGCGFGNSVDSWTQSHGPRASTHLASAEPARSCLGHWVCDLSNLLPHFQSWNDSEKFRMLAAPTSTARANRKSSKLSYLLPMPAGWDRHASLLASLRGLTQPHLSPGLKCPSSNQIVAVLFLPVVRIIG